jgi:hypothetical protein
MGRSLTAPAASGFLARGRWCQQVNGPDRAVPGTFDTPPAQW